LLLDQCVDSVSQFCQWRTVVSGRLYVIKGLKRTHQIIIFERCRHVIGL
jgi:hypothetical protein